MLLETQGKFWYIFEDRTTRTSDYMTGESDFCRFLRNEAPKWHENLPTFAIQFFHGNLQF